MGELGPILERIERRVSMPEPAMERMLRRRERRERNERIAAAVMGLGIAAAGIAGAVVTLRVATGTRPASEGGGAAAGAGGGFVLPTVAIWAAVVALGLTALAVGRLRAQGGRMDVEQEGRGPGRVAAPARRPAAVPGTAPRRGGSEMDSKPKTGVGIPQADMPPIRFDDGKLRRTNRWLIGGVVVLAVAVVALGVALMAASGEDAAPAPPAGTGGAAIVPYTAGSIMNAEVTFDGTRCSYTGPTEVAEGTEAVFGFTGTGGLTLARLAPGVTWEQVERASVNYPPSDPPSWVTGAQNEIGSGTLRAGALDEGLYFVGCATGPTSGDKMFPAVMLRVIGT